MGLFRTLFGGGPSPGAAVELALSNKADRPASPRFSVDIDSGVLYGVPSLDDFIYGRARISREEALAVPAVKRARDLICGEIGQFPLLLIGPDGTPIDWSLLNQPEAGVARSVTMTRTVEDLLLYERSWWRTSALGWHGRTIEVVRLDAANVTVQPQTIVYSEGSAQVWPDVPGLFRIDSPNSGILSSPAIRSCIALSRAAQKAAEGLPPADWFTPTDGIDPVNDDDVKDVLAAWQKARAAGRTAYIPAALQYNRDGFNPEQLQLAQSREFAVTEIARLTGIDAEELSVSTTSRTYANMNDRRRQRIDSVLGPYMTAIEDRLSMEDVTPRGFRVKFDTSAYLRSDDLTTAQTDEILIRSGVLLPEEARAKRSLTPLAPGATAATPPALPSTQEAVSNG